MDFLINKEQFEKEIRNLEETSSSRLLACSRIIRYCREILEVYRSELRGRSFNSVSEEISFFKEHKQIPLTSLIFYLEVRSIELGPSTSNKYKGKLLHKKIKKINKFFRKNREFQKYVELEQNFMDEFYYIRGFLNKLEAQDTPLYWDAGFSTSHDLLLARFRAYQKLLPYLQSQLVKLSFFSQEPVESNLNWTSPTVALIELIYALHFSGAINNGSADIIAIATVFEKVFNIKLDNIYKKFSEIKGRKGRRTKFIDELIQLFEQRLNRDEAL
ncbi:RteC domain-containing protein [Autumnicola musiva]|uniref:RteC domain-containing protein n=1 Tax=Autumnicola musiva TaxID=3075589 RepID=A0ABU3D8D2_9FLAO|nr:RteC domain-containing protein [Zunongwangia sp. F117]MDT0677787.1 RteC domain-containing protein [Zunongwangia sp. F117]